MLQLDNLERRWTRLSRNGVIRRRPELTHEGLLLGAGTCLAKIIDGEGGTSVLALDGSRILALLSVAYARPIPVTIVETLCKVSDLWSRGEEALAQIHLSLCRLPPLETEEQAFRLFAADALLAAGLTPRQLMKGLNLDTAPLELLQRTIPISRAFPRAMGVKAAGGEMVAAQVQRHRPCPKCRS